MEFDVDALTELVADFCRSRDVYTRSRCRVVYKLEKAFEIIDRIGPDRRWKTIASRRSGSDFPSSNNGMRGTTVERIVYDLSLIEWANDNSRRAASPWYLSHTVVSAAHWARFSHAIRVARKHGLGWMIPANKDVLIVPRPSLRRLEDRPDVLHNDNGQMAVEWSDGSGYYFLRGTRFSENLYTRIIKGELSQPSFPTRKRRPEINRTQLHDLRPACSPLCCGTAGRRSEGHRTLPSPAARSHTARSSGWLRRIRLLHPHARRQPP